MPHVTDYDRTDVSFTGKHVTVMGPGQGRDLIHQEGRYYTSFGKQIEPTQQALKEEGIPWTPEIAGFIQKQELRKKEARLKEAIDKKIRELETREKNRLLQSLNSPTLADKSDESDIEQEIEDIDLSGIDELLAEAEAEVEELDVEPELPTPPAQVKAKAKPKPKGK